MTKALLHADPRGRLRGVWTLAPAERWARRQITEWLPVGDDEPVCDECMLTFWRRLVVWDEPPGG